MQPLRADPALGGVGVAAFCAVNPSSMRRLRSVVMVFS
jgi:hypothetical protein